MLQDLHPVALFIPQHGHILGRAPAHVAYIGPRHQQLAVRQSKDVLRQGQGCLPGHTGLTQHRGILLPARAIENGPVFTQVGQLVLHRGKQPPQGVKLPPGGGTEDHTPLPQLSNDGEQTGPQLGLPVGQQRSINITDDQFYHRFLSP